MSELEAATAQWLTTTPAEVCSVAFATAVALPTAAVSLAMALAVDTPADDAANDVVSVSVAAAVPGVPTVPARRKTSLGLAPRAVVCALETVSRNAVEWVTAMVVLLQVRQCR